MASAGTHARLRWLCRRGMRELDLLLEDFLRREGTRLTPSECKHLQQLLQYTDMELMDWINGSADIPLREWGSLIERIRTH